MAASPKASRTASRSGSSTSRGDYATRKGLLAGMGVMAVFGSKEGSYTPRKYGNKQSGLDFGSEIWESALRMNRLLSKLRHGDRTTNGNGVGHVRVAGRNASRPSTRRAYVLTAAETAPCTCPDFCERDHENE